MKAAGHIERFVPGQVVGPVAASHLARYRYACGLVAGRRVGDVACGAGYGCRMLAEAGAAQVVGIDLEFGAVREAAAAYRHPQVALLAGDAGALPVATGGLEVIVSFETIEHLRAPERFLGEARRVLGRGGLLLLSTPNREVTRLSLSRYWRRRPSNPFHVREFTRPELLRLLRRNGFVVEEELGQHCLPAHHARLSFLLWLSLRGIVVRDHLRKRLYDVERTQPPDVRAIGSGEVPLFLVLRCRSEGEAVMMKER